MLMSRIPFIVVLTLLLTIALSAASCNSPDNTDNIRMSVTITGLEKGEKATLTILPEITTTDEKPFFMETVKSDGEGSLTVDVGTSLKDGYYQLLLEAPDKYFREPKGYLFAVHQSQIVNPTGMSVIFSLLSKEGAPDEEALISLSAPERQLQPRSDFTSLFFLVQKEIPSVHMTALAEGTLVQDGGYLRLKRDIDSALLIWPYGFTQRTEGGEIQVFDGSGRVVARVGDNIKVGGGEVSAKMAEQYIGRPLPADCPGPYWIVSEVVERDEGSPDIDSEKYADLFEKYKDTPELFDIAVYAEHYGITMDEAQQRFEIREAFSGLDTELENKEPETFAGLWIQHEPVYRIMVAFTRDGEETIKKYVSENLTNYVQVLTVKYSYAELLDAQSEVMSALRDLDIPFDSAGYVQENRVEFRVTDRTKIDEAVREGKLKIPECVHIIVVKGLAQPT